MGNSCSNTVVNHYEEIENIDDDDLDKRQKKFKQAILEIYNDIKEIKKSKCDRIMYRLPVQLCNWSIF